jgi:adenylate cyclase
MDEPSIILVVDDDQSNRDILVQKLDALGYQAIEARNGREALAKVAQLQPDLILLDVVMPIMDGFEACRALKAKDETRFIHIVIMTALHAVEDRIKGFEAGANEFLTKPVDGLELEARIRAALNQKHAVDNQLRQVTQTRDHYAKFIPEVVKRLVAENPDAPELDKREQDAAFVFIDISGYTALSATMSADSLSHLVERYFSAFLDKIHEFNGEISNTAGDGLMIIFNRGDPDDHTRMAAKTALSLMAETNRLNAVGQGPTISVHVGISSGRAAVGSTRFEGLRSVRWVYTAEGFVTNLGARLADLAEAGQILLCPETTRRLDGVYQVQPLGRTRLKGIAEPVEVGRLEIRNEGPSGGA